MRGWYSRDTAIIDPGLFVPEDWESPKSGVVVFVKRVYDWMRAAVGEVELERRGGLLGARSFFTTEDGLGVFHSYFGSPAAVALVEVLIAGRIRELVILGEAGAISPDIRLGGVLVPTFAVREEGTSYHYLPPDAPAKPSEEVKGKIKGLLEEEGIPYKEGGVWTTDAVFRETRDKVVRYSSQGVLAVEMECSALFSVAEYRGVEAGALLIITDELHGRRWREAFNDPEVVEKGRRVSELLAKNWPRWPDRPLRHD